MRLIANCESKKATFLHKTFFRTNFIQKIILSQFRRGPFLFEKFSIFNVKDLSPIHSSVKC